MTKAILTVLAVCIISMVHAQDHASGSIVLNVPDASSRNGVYSGKFRTDSVFFGNQLSFINRDTAVFFLDDRASRLRDIACATYYRVAPLSQYYQFDGMVTDYYLDNDAVAARLSYKAGMLDGPCVFYYRNGQIREKGTYTKNTRTGIWEYYYENGNKAKTIRLADDGPYLIDCYTEKGDTLARNGKGRFEGRVDEGNPSNPIESKMAGPIKDSLPDGDWKIYMKYSPDAMEEEHFSAGRFTGGTSHSRLGTRQYTDRFFSTVESVHPMEVLDYYAYDNFCLAAGKSMKFDFGTEKTYTDIGSAVRGVLQSKKFHDYTGWVLLDMHYDRKGHLAGKSVRLYDQNEAFRTSLLTMIDRLPTPGRFELNGKPEPFERFYVLLVQADEVVMPEEILYKQRMQRLKDQQ